MDQPYQHCLQFHDLLLHYNRFHNDELVEAINRVRIEDVIAHSQRILSQAHAEMLVHGNFVESEALQLGKIVCEGLKYTKLFPSQFPERRVVEIAPGSNNCYSVPGYNQEDLNSAILVSFQIGEETTGMRALADLLAQILSEPCYSQLRTEEQLGYIVGSGVDSQRGVVSLRIIVQSSVKPPEFLEERVDNFLAKFKEILKGMTKSDFEQYVQVLIALKLEKDKSLSQESTRHFLEISRRRYDFNRREKEVEELNRISH
jgi:insulysin